jgi:hypothetical protein
MNIVARSSGISLLLRKQLAYCQRSSIRCTGRPNGQTRFVANARIACGLIGFTAPRGGGSEGLLWNVCV